MTFSSIILKLFWDSINSIISNGKSNDYSNFDFIQSKLKNNLLEEKLLKEEKLSLFFKKNKEWIKSMKSKILSLLEILVKRCDSEDHDLYSMVDIH